MLSKRMSKLEELIEKQNILLKGLLALIIEMLPRHSSTCYGLQVHPGNRERCCDCNMDEIRQMASKLIEDVKDVEDRDSHNG